MKRIVYFCFQNQKPDTFFCSRVGIRKYYDSTISFPRDCVGQRYFSSISHRLCCLHRSQSTSRNWVCFLPTSYDMRGKSDSKRFRGGQRPLSFLYRAKYSCVASYPENVLWKREILAFTTYLILATNPEQIICKFCGGKKTIAITDRMWKPQNMSEVQITYKFCHKDSGFA